MTHSHYSIPYEKHTTYLFFCNGIIIPYKIIKEKTCKIFNKNIFSIKNEIIQAEREFKIILIRKNKLEYQLFSSLKCTISVILMQNTYIYKTIFLLYDRKVNYLPKKSIRRKNSPFYLLIFLGAIIFFEKYFSVKNY